MNSSDSGEDFESADEGVDFEETSPSTKEGHNKSDKVCDEVVEIKHDQSPDKSAENINQKLKNLTLDNIPEPKDECQDDISGLAITSNCDKTKPKLPKKLGTKLICSKRDVQDNKEDFARSNFNINDKTNVISKHEENLKITSKQDFNSHADANKLNVSELSDGWDFEEEDGFSIPQQTSTSPLRHENLQEKAWGSWSAWGVSSLLTTATDSVSTFSSQVTAGLSTVLETTVGAPDPEALAASTSLEIKRVEDVSKNEDEKTTSYSGLSSLVSGVSLLGSSVINRGLDTLETLGKKTMDVLQEGDPGLKKKRALLFADQDKPVLSQILREAKEKAEHNDKENEEKETARRAHFESLFDDFQGMVHLEALEMLSTQCELKLQSMLLGESGTALDDLQETLSQVRDLCELPDDEDESEVLTRDQFNEQVTKCLDGLRIKYSADKITQVNDAVIARLDRLGAESETAVVVHQTAISSLAEVSAAAMECFHKSAELLMAKTLHNTTDEADSYIQLTSVMCARVSAIANEFTQLLTKNHPIANSSSITNIFLEASNSCSYMKNACQLLVPIIQLGAVSS